MTAATTLVWSPHGGSDLRVELKHTPEMHADVRVWLDGHGRAEPVLLTVDSRSDYVAFRDLVCNGFGSEKQGIGLGTLAVNTAIQALKRYYPANAPVRGYLSNPPEDRLPRDHRVNLEEARRAFWRRFGMEIAAGDAEGKEYIVSTVGQLTCIERGTVAGLYPRYVPLEDFKAQG